MLAGAQAASPGDWQSSRLIYEFVQHDREKHQKEFMSMLLLEPPRLQRRTICCKSSPSSSSKIMWSFDHRRGLSLHDMFSLRMCFFIANLLDIMK